MECSLYSFTLFNFYSLHDHADGQQNVRINPLLAGGDGEGNILAAGGFIEGEPFDLGEVERGVARFTILRNSSKIGGSFFIA